MPGQALPAPDERLRRLRETEFRGEPLDLLLFWGHASPADGRIGPHVLSQWWRAPFEVRSIVYPTAEHFMMASKASLFGDRDSLERILSVTGPKEAKQIGRVVRGFVEDVWTRRRYELVVEGNLAKFVQNRDLHQYLQSTGEAVLVEASPFDRIWGIGLSRDSPVARLPSRWKGLNLLGFALMEVRDLLRNPTC